MPTLIHQYIREIEKNLKTGDATEHTHRPALKILLESINRKNNITATNEPKQSECGAPDYKITKTPGPVTIGYIEAKDIGISLTKTQNSSQLKRYRKALPNLILTDYLNFKWFVNDENWGEASFGSYDSQKRKITTNPNNINAVTKLLSDFLAQDPTPITKPKDLAQRMAHLAHMIRDIVIESFATKKASNLIADLRKAMAQALIPDLEENKKTKEFADLYAQTLTYGLFAARCNHNPNSGKFTRQNAATEIPKTNPFLRELFDTITGTQLDSEPYINFVEDLVEILDHARIKEILKDFGKSKGQKDPVLHFYETFLAAYDPKMREARGVYYTPEPVVQYIVRSVDHLLKTKFNIPEGLADSQKLTYDHTTDTKINDEYEIEKKETHRTLILDPAAGTGTFLYAVVSQIRSQFEKKKQAGMWSGYVHEHLLPRILGFEILMAPYAVAHFKLAMQLAALDLPESRRTKWAYDFNSEERLGIYLTNTLQSIERHVQQLLGPYHIISDEANAANKVKRELPILVVLGNPPYSGISSNRSEYEEYIPPGSNYTTNKKGKMVTHVAGVNGKKIKHKTFIGRILDSYYFVDGKPLGEKKVWLQDDYVKFIRWAQWRIEQSGHGILAFITNHGYIDNSTFRGMRQALMNSFDEIYILDLHGNTNRREIAPDGSPDNNVFDIKQGVAIALFVKLPPKDKNDKVVRASRPSVFHAELFGLRESKYEYLLSNTIKTTKWTELNPAQPFYLFRPYDAEAGKIYNQWHKITDIMPVNVTGVVTARDHFVIDFDDDALLARMRDLRNENISDQQIREKYFAGKGSSKYPAGDSRGWKLPKARENLRNDTEWDKRITSILYRPFDERRIYYSDWMVDWPRTEAMPHMIAGENVGLIYMRQVALGDAYSHFGVSTCPVDNRAFYSNKGIMSFAPLYLYPNIGKNKQHSFDQWPDGKNGRRPNLDPDFVNNLAQNIKLKFISDGLGDLKSTFGPEDILHYIYAIFHSPTYRTRYAEFLKLDFPRVPLTTDRNQFITLCNLGRQLIALHLLEDQSLTGNSIAYPNNGTNKVERGYPKFVNTDETPGRVHINPDQYFEPIEPEVWNFQIGGYQVPHKWLKDRKERTLTHDEIKKYTKIIEALRKTIQLMNDIDKAIPTWPM